MVLYLGCSGGDADSSAEPAARAETASGSPAATPPPVEAPSGPIDRALASRGEEVFTVKGCVACHYVGRDERLVGPDLEGVTSKRTWPWFYAMITNPDSMIRNDPEARALFAEYMTPMSKQGLTDEEVQAVWEYLRDASSDGGGS
ncbi:MAG: cytochrome c [Gemmatimonadota bacterium]|nr:cytochrome c [Gemmatimonadota bacterium]